MDTKIEDSNLAFIGSDEDKAARKVRESNWMLHKCFAAIHEVQRDDSYLSPPTTTRDDICLSFQTLTDHLLFNYSTVDY
jgi:hypothetical protein